MPILGTVASGYNVSVEVTGGTLTSDETYNYRTFTSNGNLVVTGGTLICDYSLVAGGGTGGSSQRGSVKAETASYAGGGGGASTGIGGQHNGYEEFVGWPGGYVGDAARRVVAGAGGGGGGSSWVNGGHGNPDGTGTHGSASDRSGLVFIAQRV